MPAVRSLFVVLALLAVPPTQAAGGNYAGKGADASGLRWNVHAKVKSVASGQYDVRVTSWGTNSGCVGDVSGIGVLRRNVLTVARGCEPSGFFKGGCSRGETPCHLSLALKGRTMRIKQEGKGCFQLHGTQCTFEGQLVRTK